MVLWMKPPVGWFKRHVEGSYQGNMGPCGEGGVIQDEDVNLKVTFFAKYEDGTNNGAKLEALISGIKLCKTMNHQNIIIEMDSTLVVSWLMKHLCPTWYLWDF